MRKVASIRASTAHEKAEGEAWASEWQTQDRISRRRGVGYCVIEAHEFDVGNADAPPRIAYRVYHEIRGFPVGDPLASFSTRQAAQRHAEARGNDLRSDLRAGLARAGSA